MNTAIIVAAGSGTRFGSDRPKQYLTLFGKPIIVHTINRFQYCRSIDEIVVVVAAEEVDQVRQLLINQSIDKLSAIVAGGPTRAASVRNGFAAVSPQAEVVAVHDGVRPLVTVDEIELTIKIANEKGAACLVAPVTDTIKLVENGSISRTIERTLLRRALTPQSFRYDILSRALEQDVSDADVTDECYLVEKLGVEITLVDGSSRNIKITNPEDLILAEAFLTERRSR